MSRRPLVGAGVLTGLEGCARTVSDRILGMRVGVYSSEGERSSGSPAALPGVLYLRRAGTVAQAYSMKPRARDPWAELDATAQAELVSHGDVAPHELAEAACLRIERLDPDLNAVPLRLFEGVNAAPSIRGAAFAGVPFLMKDVGARQAGQPYYAGNRALQAIDHRAEADTPLGARFRALGLVTVGKSNTPEFGLQSNTWPLIFGPVRNPWDPLRSAGGSSGGACAAVAAGLVPVAHASDGAGSIRIPAAWCGLVGMKPSRDRIVWRHAGSGSPEIEFVVARSLRDTAAFVDLLRVPERDVDPREFRSALSVTSSPMGTSRAAPLRVGLCTSAPSGVPVERACSELVERIGDRLSNLGHRVERAHPSSLQEYEERALYGAITGPLEYRRCLEDLARRLGRSLRRSDVEPFLWELADHEQSATDDDVVRAARWSQGWIARTLRWFDEFDLLVTPTVPGPAPLLRELDPTRLAPMELLERFVPHMVFTEPWNATGQPAISLPLGASAEGLPIGVQLVAGPARDALLLSVAGWLMLAESEPALGRPPLHA